MRAYIEKASVTVTLIPTIQLYKWHSHRVVHRVTMRYNVLEIKFLFLKYKIILEIENKKELDINEK